MATEKPRYSITVDEELFEQIEEFRFANRFQTRSQATVELVRIGLKAIREKGGEFALILEHSTRDVKQKEE